MGSWYKQNRAVTERPWFKEANLVQLYVTLKSLAYVNDGRYEGQIIRRGSCTTTRADLSEITGMKRMTLDRCLKKLINYGEIIVNACNRFSVITICDYDSSDDSNSLFRATDGIAVGNTDENTDGIAVGNPHLSTIEYKDNKDNKILISPDSPYKKEREARNLALEIKKLYNKTFDGILPPCVRLSTSTGLMVEECIRRFGRQSVDMVFEQIMNEPFSLGANKTGFQANFTFIFKPSEFQKYLERAQLAKKKQQPEVQQPAKSVGVFETTDNDYLTPSQKAAKNRKELQEYIKNNPNCAAAKYVKFK